jgi:hypothetical protein
MVSTARMHVSLSLDHFLLSLLRTHKPEKEGLPRVEENQGSKIQSWRWSGGEQDPGWNNVVKRIEFFFFSSYGKAFYFA